MSGKTKLGFVVGGAVVFVCLLMLVVRRPHTAVQNNGAPASVSADPAAVAIPSDPRSTEADYQPRSIVPPCKEILKASTNTTMDQAVTIALRDGTRVTCPSGLDHVVVQVERQTAAADLRQHGLSATGSNRLVRYDFEALQETPDIKSIERFMPTITIPAAETGDIEPRTLVIARIGDTIVNGRVVKNLVTFLPAQRMPNGDLTAVDVMMPSSIIPERFPGLVRTDVRRKRITFAKYRSTPTDLLAFSSRALPSAQAPVPAREKIFPRDVIYVASTFQGHLNWAREPLLIRMAPRSGAVLQDACRTPINQLHDEQKKQELAQPVFNVIVLVHGHNEAEKGGNDLVEAGYPWQIGYKRDVWTLLYHAFVRDYEPQRDCTAFFEFVYPTYRPIFSEVSGVQRLDRELADRLAKALEPQLKAGIKFNLFIVAHSMGGITSRAGIQRMHTDLHAAFRNLVTWGSPHLGTPLATLRYALTALPAYDIGPEGQEGNVPLGNLQVIRDKLGEYVLDTPGTQDCRWCNGLKAAPRLLNLDNIFKLSADQSGDNDLLKKFDLLNGSHLYSENLRTLNEQDVYRLDKRYIAMFGVTSKRAKVIPQIWWPPVRVEGTETAIGATAMFWLMKNSRHDLAGHPRGAPMFQGYPQGASDGCISLASMMGVGVMGEKFDLGDIDHEEYFGAPKSPGKFSEVDKAMHTAASTFEQIGLSRFTGPQLIINPLDGGADRNKISGRLLWPGDDEIGTRIPAKSIQCLINDKALPIASVKVEKDGRFDLLLDAAHLPATLQEVTVVVPLADETRLTSRATVRLAPVRVRLTAYRPMQLKDEVGGKWMANESRFRVFQNGKEISGDAFNTTLFNLAPGKYEYEVKYQYDWIHPQRREFLVESLKSDSEIGTAQGSFSVVPGAGPQDTEITIEIASGAPAPALLRTKDADFWCESEGYWAGAAKFVTHGFARIYYAERADGNEAPRKMRIEARYSHGKQNGPMKSFSPGGALKALAHYKDGLLDGESKSFYEKTGTPSYERNYVQGKLEGVERGFYPDGRLDHECTYVKGNKEGLEKKYWEDGKLRSEEMFKDGSSVKGTLKTYPRSP